MRKAIVFTSYNRSDYLKQTLLSWRDVANKNGYDFFFKLEPSSMQKKMESRMINFLSEQKLYGDVINNSEKKGVLVNPWEGLNHMFEQGYDFVILAEDDIEVADDILHFFDDLSERHVNDEEVLAICASSYHLWKDSEDTRSYAKQESFCPLIWGTWKDRWDKYLRDTWDKDYSTGKNGVGAGWDWNIALRVIPQNNLKCIYPSVSRSKHIGVVGVHMQSEKYNESVAVSFNRHNEYTGYEEIDATL